MSWKTSICIGKIFPCGFNQFETRCTRKSFKVDLERKICTCILWQLNGYRCVHSVVAVYYLNNDVKSFLNLCLVLQCTCKVINTRLLAWMGVICGNKPLTSHHYHQKIKRFMTNQQLIGKRIHQKWMGAIECQRRGRKYFVVCVMKLVITKQHVRKWNKPKIRYKLKEKRYDVILLMI